MNLIINGLAPNGILTSEQATLAAQIAIQFHNVLEGVNLSLEVRIELVDENNPSFVFTLLFGERFCQPDMMEKYVSDPYPLNKWDNAYFSVKNFLVKRSSRTC